MSDNETIHESDTGAKKARNDVRMSLVPTEELLELAQHYGRGSEKYGAENWRKGMPFSWHYDALQRHLLKWWGGEDLDVETGSSHLAAVQFHVFGLMYGLKHHPDQDDRYDSPAARLSRNVQMSERLQDLDEAALEDAVEIELDATTQLDSLENDSPAWVKEYQWKSCAGGTYMWSSAQFSWYVRPTDDPARDWAVSFSEHRRHTAPFTRVEK